MKNVFALSLFPLLLLFNTCNNEYQQLQSVEIDYNVIPVWYYLKTKDVEKAEKASVSLNIYLTLLHEEYASLFQAMGTEEVYGDLESVLLVTHHLIEKGQYEEAMSHLHLAIFKLSDWRACTDNEHFIDRIWDFGRSYENTRHAISDVALCLLEWNDFEKMVLDMNNFWGRVKSANAASFLTEKFSEKELGQYDFLVSTIEDCIEDFNEMVMYADREEVADFCNKIEPAYVQLVAMFGDFEPYLKPLPDDIEWKDILITTTKTTK